MPVKADAYGHGAVRVAEAALKEGVSFLAVATVEEGAELREAGLRAPILLFSPAMPDEWEAAAAARLIPFISDMAEAAAFARAGRRLSPSAKYPVFLAIDTGMGREGCAPKEAAELAGVIVESGNLSLGGTATHFSEAEDAVWTEEQLGRFKEALRAIRERGISPGLVSAANSAALASSKDARFDLARPGIMLYGCEDTPLSPRTPLKALMEFRTKIARIKKIAAGEPVSYGRVWRAARDTCVGVLPVGYADGLPRSLSRTVADGAAGFFAVVRGQRYPLAGRVCMDQCMIDLGPSPCAALSDTAVLFGDAPALSAAETGRLAGTISYEICCGISRRVTRVYE
jgi:alanine racemase